MARSRRSPATRASTPRSPPRLSGRISTELNARIESWMAKQPVPPSKTAAVQYLIELGLEVAEREHK